MSTLIKAHQVKLGTGAAARIRAPAASAPANRMPEHAAMDATRVVSGAKVDTMAQRLSEIECAYAKLEHEVGTRERAAYEKGLTEGKIAGEQCAGQDYAAQREALRNGIQLALDGLRAQLDSLEGLAIDVTHAALDQLLGDASRHADLVVETARHHLNQVAAGSAISVEVSRADFPDDAQLEAAFASFAGQFRTGVTARAQLPAGACLIRLTLGTLDASLDTQTARMRSALSEVRHTS
jgi:type III secretion protein L